MRDKIKGLYKMTLHDCDEENEELRWIEISDLHKTYTIFSDGTVYEGGHEYLSFIEGDVRDVEQLIRAVIDFLKKAIKHYHLEDKFKNILGDKDEEAKENC